jgi:iron complex outermembrane recepter protein
MNLTYNNGPYSLFVQGRYISNGILDHTLRQSNVTIPGVQTINDNTIGGIFYMDMNLSWQVPVQGDLNVYAEVNNLFDRAPPTDPAAYGRAGSNALNPQLYDVIGRRYTLGVRYKF